MARRHKRPFDFGGTKLYGITTCSGSNGDIPVTDRVDGTIESYHARVGGKRPVASVTTLDLDSAITILGSDFTTSGAVTGYSAKNANGVLLTTDAVKFSCLTMVTTPQSLSWSQSEASDPVSLQMISEGYTNELQFDTNETYSAFTEITSDFFGFGGISLNGTTVQDITSATVNFGITTEAERTDGDLVPSAIHIASIAPTITFTSRDPDQVKNCIGGSNPYYGPLSLNGTTGLKLYLRLHNAGGYVATGTTSHILIQMKNGIVTENGITGSPNEMNFTVTAKRTASDASLTWQSGVAISL